MLKATAPSADAAEAPRGLLSRCKRPLGNWGFQYRARYREPQETPRPSRCWVCGMSRRAGTLQQYRWKELVDTYTLPDGAGVVPTRCLMIGQDPSTKPSGTAPIIGPCSARKHRKSGSG